MTNKSSSPLYGAQMNCALVKIKEFRKKLKIFLLLTTNLIQPAPKFLGAG